MIELREVGPRGCGYPEPGGYYVECIGSPDGTLPMFVPLEPPAPYQFFRCVVRLDGDYVIEKGQVKTLSTVGEEARVREMVDLVARYIFGSAARVREGRCLKFHHDLFEILIENGWQPRTSPDTLAVQILQTKVMKDEALLKKLGSSVELRPHSPSSAASRPHGSGLGKK
jgi:hypothetical protein